MPTGIVNIFQRGFWRLFPHVVRIVLWAGLASSALGQTSPPLAGTRSLALLPAIESAQTEPAVAKAFAEYKALGATGMRRKPRTKQDRFERLQGKPNPDSPFLAIRTAAQATALANACFQETLAELLRVRLKRVLVATERVEAERNRLALQGEITEAEGARLADALNVDTLAMTAKPVCVVRERAERWVVFRAEWRLLVAPALRAGDSALVVPVCGYAIGGRSVLGGTYAVTLAEAALEAGRRAAQSLAHTLETGEAYPLASPGVRLALAPVFSPTEGDRLLFALEGRRTAVGDIVGLPAEVTSLFAPRLAPLFADSIVPAAVTKQEIFRGIGDSARLWEGDWRPNSQKIQELGRRVGVDYILLARVTYLEGNMAPPRRDALAYQEEDLLFQGRAEAVGCLVRVSDGACVWQDRRAATVNLRSGATAGRRAPSERGAILNAIRFALLALEGGFARYGANFER